VAKATSQINFSAKTQEVHKIPEYNSGAEFKPIRSLEFCFLILNFKRIYFIKDAGNQTQIFLFTCRKQKRTLRQLKKQHWFSQIGADWDTQIGGDKKIQKRSEKSYSVVRVVRNHINLSMCYSASETSPSGLTNGRIITITVNKLITGIFIYQ